MPQDQEQIQKPETKQALLGYHENVVEEHHDQPKRTIAIAVDASEFAQYAFNWAVENLITKDDQVVLLNCRPRPTPPILIDAPYVDFTDETEKWDKYNMEQSHELIRQYASSLLKKDIRVRGIALRGDPREEIVFKVDDIKADVLVIGSRGMGMIKRAFIGSTSDYCVHNAHCTVIIPRK